MPMHRQRNARPSGVAVALGTWPFASQRNEQEDDPDHQSSDAEFDVLAAANRRRRAIATSRSTAPEPG